MLSILAVVTSAISDFVPYRGMNHTVWWLYYISSDWCLEVAMWLAGDLRLDIWLAGSAIMLVSVWKSSKEIFYRNRTVFLRRFQVILRCEMVANKPHSELNVFLGHSEFAHLKTPVLDTRNWFDTDFEKLQ